MLRVNKRQVYINIIINLAVGGFYLIPIGLMDFSDDETRCWGLKSGSNRGELSVSQQWSPILVFNIEHLQDYFPTLILTISQIRSHNKHTVTNILSNGFLNSREALLIFFGKLIFFTPLPSPAKVHSRWVFSLSPGPNEKFFRVLLYRVIFHVNNESVERPFIFRGELYEIFPKEGLFSPVFSLYCSNVTILWYADMKA